jgi:hypothetical protein
LLILTNLGANEAPLGRGGPLPGGPLPGGADIPGGAIGAPLGGARG